MKKIKILPIILLIFCSCNDNVTNSNQQSNKISTSSISQKAKIYSEDSLDTLPKWKKQLQKALTKGNGKFSYVPWKIVDYKKKGIINNSEELKNLERVYLSNNRYVPQYRFSNLDNLSIKKAKNINRHKFHVYYQPLAYNRENLKAHLDTSMAVGQTIISIQWKFRNHTYTSKAIANSKSGIIYDNIGSNIILIAHQKGMKITSNESKSSIKKQKLTNQLNSIDLPPCKDTPSSGWNPSIGGYVVIKHSSKKSPRLSINNAIFIEVGYAQAELLADGYVLRPMGGYPDEKYLTCASKHGSCSYTDGKCGAEAKLTYADYGQYGSAEVAYGLYLTSGGNTVKVIFEYGDFSITISGTTNGTTKKDTGTLHFYPSVWQY